MTGRKAPFLVSLLALCICFAASSVQPQGGKPDNRHPYDMVRDHITAVLAAEHTGTVMEHIQVGIAASHTGCNIIVSHTGIPDPNLFASLAQISARAALDWTAGNGPQQFILYLKAEDSHRLVQWSTTDGRTGALFDSMREVRLDCSLDGLAAALSDPGGM